MSAVSAVPGEGRGRFTDLRWFDELDSTNRYVLDEARAGTGEGLVAVADHQTAGRGRLGRRWEAPARSSLLFSVLLRPPLEPADLHLVPAAAALATMTACRGLAGVELLLKWPNDLLHRDRKMAGILAELDLPAGGPPAVVVGVGLNVTWPGPPGAGGTSLAGAGAREVDREALLEAVLEDLERRRTAIESASGRAALVAELRRSCATLGRPVRVERVGRPVLEGIAADLSPTGCLVVETPSGSETVATGDVVHLRHPAR